jgi:FMN phosphatase YigB (HAD superfamily)
MNFQISTAKFLLRTVAPAATRWPKINLQPLRAVVFDMGKVLIDFDWTRAGRALRIAEDWPTDNPAELTATTEAISNSPEKVAFEKGQITAAEFFQAIKQQLNIQRTTENRFFEIYANIFSPIPGTNELILKLQAAGLTTIILSDTSTVHYDHLYRTFEAVRKADDGVISFITGHFKSDPSSFNFHEVIRKLTGWGIPPGGAIFFDDINDYVERAIQLGLPAWQFTTAAEAAEVIRAVWKIDL